MLATRTLLQQLLTWTVQHQNALDQYVKEYPYPKYEGIDATNTFRHKISDILNNIIKNIANSKINSRDKYGLNRQSENVNGMCAVKNKLDQLRVVFLTVHNIKKISGRQIISKIQQIIELANSQSAKSQLHNEAKMQRNRSYDQIQRSNKPFEVSKPWERPYSGVGYACQKQKERTDRVKNQLYEQMVRDLTKRQQIHRLKINELDEFQQRRKRIVSDYQKARADLPPKYVYNRMPRNHLIQVEAVLEKEKNKREKRIFKYLDEDKQEQILQRYQSERPQMSYETPHAEKYKTLPSTEPKSTPQSRYLQENLDDELPELQIDEQRLFELKQKLDFQLKLSKIKPSQEPPHEGWESFEGDSIEEPNEEHSAGLDDSLELMKQEEAMNKTGSFNPVLVGSHEIHEYSFSRD